MAKRDYRIILMRADDNVATNAPQLPNTFEIVAEDNNWFTIYPQGRTNSNLFVHARCMVRGAGAQSERACYVFMGTAAQMQALEDRAQAAKDAGATWIRIWNNLAALRDDTTAAAVAVKNAWRDERPLDENGNPIGFRAALYSCMSGFGEDNGE